MLVCANKTLINDLVNELLRVHNEKKQRHFQTLNLINSHILILIYGLEANTACVYTYLLRQGR